jgi:hypothetical protein
MASAQEEEKTAAAAAAAKKECKIKSFELWMHPPLMNRNHTILHSI